jgi:hypothetical protein
MKLPNLTNAFGTITAILTALTAFMASIGCAPGASDFTANCSIPWLPTTWTPIAAGIFGVLTLLGKLVRPGGFLHSLFGGTAVITSTPSVGTVTPAQVASPK